MHERDTRITPSWDYRPGPDVADDPPEGLIKAQAIARAAAMAGTAASCAGASELDIEAAVNAYLRSAGISRVWTITNIGVGEDTFVCFPTRPPGDLKASAMDVAMIDVHPITEDGSWGDCTRCQVIGDFPAARKALAELEIIHQKVLASCRPGIPARELFGICSELLKADGFELLDQLGNIGHSLTAGAAYLHGFIDDTNHAGMWGAWAIEPFAARDGVAVKVEDVVWFGRNACTVV
jgi:Xaa-Pro dipeptidase